MPSFRTLLTRLLFRAVLLGLPFLGTAFAAEGDAGAAAAPPERLVVLDFELIGDAGDASFAAGQRARMTLVSERLREDLRESGLYEVADNGPAEPLIERLSAGQYLHRCNGCEFDIARQLDARYVLVPWVYRVSNLILTMHAELRDAATGQVVMKRALDFRGDNDKAWLRAAAYLVRDMKEAAAAGSGPAGGRQR